MVSNILDTPTTPPTKTIGMILLWSRTDCNNYDYDLESHIDIKWITIEPDIDKQFFSGRDLEKIISKLENDESALTCYVSRSLDKIIISKEKERGLSYDFKQ